MAFARKVLVKIGAKPVGDEVRTFARIKKVIWDQLLATKADIIQSKLYFRFACEKLMNTLNFRK